jgi:hypothetical protein
MARNACERPPRTPHYFAIAGIGMLPAPVTLGASGLNRL